MNKAIDKIIDNKELIYSVLFYAAGLLLGSFLFAANSEIKQAIKPIVECNSTSLQFSIISRIILYSALFLLTILLSFSVIGFAIIDSVPFIIGLIISIKTAYFYSLSGNNIIHCLLTVIPEASLLITILLFAVKNEKLMSKSLYSSSIRKPEVMIDYNIKAYLRLYTVYFLLVNVIAVINSLIIWFSSKL